ncbi:MAG: rhomboid family intramembrane serine protease [Marinilabiliaceae bacterium]|nr:rhomboid family intramembrane serine protease [Marinilabiliaceae bacterium]
MSIWQEIKNSYRIGSVLTRLIYINLAVFLALQLIYIIVALTSGPGNENNFTLLYWISVPSDPGLLFFKPWTLITYMFVHFKFLHTLINILYLYWFGKIFTEILGQNRILPVYLLGGLAGAFMYIIGINYIPVFYHYFPSNILMGASASVMAILLAAAVYSPNFRLNLMFIGEVRLKYIALVFIIIDVISIGSFENTGGTLAHLGGAMMGYIYATLLTKGKDIAKPIESAIQFSKTSFKPKSKLKVTYKRPMTDMEYNAHKVRRQKEVDRILEKIKQSGYDSLSKEEKKILFEASQEK